MLDTILSFLLLSHCEARVKFYYTTSVDFFRKLWYNVIEKILNACRERNIMRITKFSALILCAVILSACTERFENISAPNDESAAVSSTDSYVSKIDENSSTVTIIPTDSKNSSPFRKQYYRGICAHR